MSGVPMSGMPMPGGPMPGMGFGPGGYLGAPQLVQIGDFLVSPEAVQVPGGTFPVAGTSWRLTDIGVHQTRIPVVAIVLAIVLIPCTGLLSLLFLLMKEQYVNGYVTVDVSGPGMGMSTRVFVTDDAALYAVRRSVEQAQAWSFSGWQRSGG
jgi:hypothetical protein